MNCKRIWPRLAILAAWALGCPGPAPAATAPATLSLDQIIEGMERFDRTFNGQESWLVRFEQKREMKNPPPGFVKDYPDATFVTARRGKDLYFYSESKSMDGEPTRRWCLWKDDLCVYRFNDAMSILPELSIDAYEVFFYTDGLFLDTYRDLKFVSPSYVSAFGADSPSAARWDALPRAITGHRGEFSVRPETEEVDGSPCHVLERPGKDEIWVDPNRGFVVARRRYYQSPGRLLFESENQGIVKRTSMIWTPKKQVMVRYNIESDGTEYMGKIRSIETNILQEISFRPLDNSILAVPVMEQGIVHDEVRNTSYVKYPKGVNPFEMTSELAKRQLLPDPFAIRLNILLFVVFVLGTIAYAGRRALSWGRWPWR